MIEAIRREVDALIELGVGIGGPANQEVETLTKFRQIVSATMRKAAAGNAEVAQKLEEAEAFHQRYSARFTLPFTAQVSRENSPIPSEELVPSLLMEDPKAIAIFMQGIDSDVRNRIYHDALLILRKALDDGVALGRQDEVLAALKGSQ